jgi:hypothetical protein
MPTRSHEQLDVSQLQHPQEAVGPGEFVSPHLEQDMWWTDHTCTMLRQAIRVLQNEFLPTMEEEFQMIDPFTSRKSCFQGFMNGIWMQVHKRKQNGALAHCLLSWQETEHTQQLAAWERNE